MTSALSHDDQPQLYVSGEAPAALPETGNAGGRRPHWYETPYGAWRLSAEREAMERFPSFELLGFSDPLLYWLGWLRSSIHSDRRYLAKVTYCEAFPEFPPEVSIEWPAILDGPPHMLGPGRPCLYLPSQGPHNGYEPGRTTAATLVSWLALWIHAYETWQATGRWPGRSD